MIDEKLEVTAGFTNRWADDDLSCLARRWSNKRSYKVQIWR